MLDKAQKRAIFTYKVNTCFCAIIKTKKKMKTYTFIDILTNETFEITCEPFEVHNIENTNKELGKWCEGRILIRIENEN